MNPLKVSYSPTIPEPREGMVYIDYDVMKIMANLHTIIDNVNNGTIDEIVCVGKQIVTGWRVPAYRTVVFDRRSAVAGGLTEHEIAQLEGRVKQRDPL